jgi:hypothetical protein
VLWLDTTTTTYIHMTMGWVSPGLVLARMAWSLSVLSVLYLFVYSIKNIRKTIHTCYMYI